MEPMVEHTELVAGDVEPVVQGHTAVEQFLDGG
jgi:hypothetical protein